MSTPPASDALVGREAFLRDLKMIPNLLCLDWRLAFLDMMSEVFEESCCLLGAGDAVRVGRTAAFATGVKCDA